MIDIRKPSDKTPITKYGSKLWYVQEFVEEFPTLKDAFLLRRVSKDPQRIKGTSTQDQQRSLMQCVRDNHFNILGGTSTCESGYCNMEDKEEFFKAVELYKELGAQFMLAESKSRYARHKDYGKNKSLVATQENVDWLYEKTEHTIPFVTVNDPNLDSSEERSLQTKRGIAGRKLREKGRIKQRKEDWLARVLELDQDGLSSMHIVKRILEEGGPRISFQTAARWLKELKI